MRLRTGAAALAIVASVTLALAGCGSGGDSGSGSKAKLEFQTNLPVGDPTLKALTTATKQFEKDNPGVTISLVPRTDTYEQDIKVRLAAKNPPDLWATHGWSVARYSEFLAPLQDEAWAKNVNKQLDATMRDGDGNLYAMPVDTDIAGILYNKKVLSDNGIDPTTIKTWADFDAACATLKAAGVTPIASSGKDNWFAGDDVDWLLSGAYSQSDLKSMKSGTFVASGYKKTLDEIKSWKDNGYLNPDYSSATTDDIAQSIAQNKTAFAFFQNSLAANVKQYSPDTKLGYLPVPTFTGDPSYLIGGEGQAYGAAKDGKHVDIAKKYLAYLAKPANDTKLAATLGNAPGMTDATPSLGDMQDSYDTFAKSGDNPLVPYFDRAYLPNGFWDTMVRTADGVITGQTTVSAALTQAQKDFTSLYGQSNG